MIGIPLLVLIVLGLSQIEFMYESNSTVVYDPRDSAITDRAIRYPDFNQISSSFLALANDSELLDEIIARLPWFAEIYVGAEKPVWQSTLAELLPPTMVPNAWLLNDEPYRQMLMRNGLTDRLKLESVPLNFELVLTAAAESPTLAQELNNVVMTVFVESQLTSLKGRVDASLTALADYYNREKYSAEGLSEVFELYEKDSTPLNLSKAEKKNLKDRERNLVNKILRSQEEQQQTTASEIQRKLELEAQLALLLSQKGRTHPEVIQKQGELNQAKATEESAAIKSRLNQMMRQLIELQARMKRAGVPIDPTIQFQNLTPDGRLFLTRLSELVKEHQLEQENLARQLAQPETRSRYRYAIYPTSEAGLGNKKRIALVGFAAIALLGGALFSIVILREVYNPKLHDSWKFKNLFPSINIQSELFPREAKKLGAVSLTAVNRFQRQLLQGSKAESTEASALQKIRSAIASIPAKDGARVAMISASSDNRSGLRELGLLSAGLVASSEKRDTVLIDLRPQKSYNEDHDLIDFLEGRCKWRDVKNKRELSPYFDSVGVGSHHEGVPSLALGAFGSLIMALRKQYQTIIIQAYPRDLFIENQKVAQLTDGWIDFIDLRRTPKSSLGYLTGQKDYRVVLVTA